MARPIGWILLLGLGGCAAMGPDGWQAGARSAAHYDFDWQLSGDPAVAPLQVFGSDTEVWLQFAPGQQVPAIFADTPRGSVPVPFRRQPPYVVVDGPWRSLVLRGGRYVARAARQDADGLAGRVGFAAAENALPAAAEPAVPGTTPAAQASAAAASPPLLRPTVPPPAAGAVPSAPLIPAPGAGPDAAMPLPGAVVPGGRGAPAAPHPPLAGAASTAAASAPLPASTTLSPPGPVILRAGPPDATLRAVLARWAASSGWTFQPQHWAVDVDIPLAGSAEFDGDFKQAVRGLLGSTELTERPVQPCFYANRVLRVVPYTQACDRSAAQGGAAS